jgi:hypothetical protein
MQLFLVWMMAADDMPRSRLELPAIICPERDRQQTENKDQQDQQREQET